MSDKKTIDLRILNSSFSVIATDEKNVKEIAAFVNDNLNEILKRNPYSNHMQISLLGCLNIAEMYFDEKKKIQEKENELFKEIKKTEEIAEHLEIVKSKIDELNERISSYDVKVKALEDTISEKEDLLNQYRDQLQQAKVDSESNRHSLLDLQSQLFESQMQMEINNEEEKSELFFLD